MIKEGWHKITQQELQHIPRVLQLHLHLRAVGAALIQNVICVMHVFVDDLYLHMLGQLRA